jgi:cysteine sulfinate desulfinase/cysteine desulfurase-like protein
VAAIPETMRITMAQRSAKNKRLQTYKNYIVNALISRFSLGDYSQYYGKSDDYDPFVDSSSNVSHGRMNYDIVFLGPTKNGLPDPEHAAPNTLYFAVVKQAPLAKHFCNINLRDALFEDHRVIASIGSACSASSGGGSHVLTAIKAPYIIRCGVIRISFGDPTTWKQVYALRNALIQSIEKQSI